MQITSILIGGIERVAQTYCVRDFQITHDAGERMGTAHLKVLMDPRAGFQVGIGVIGTAQLGVTISPGQTIEIYKEGERNIFGEPLWGQPLFGETGVSELAFRGTIVRVEPSLFKSVQSTGTSQGGAFGEFLFGDPLFGGGGATAIDTKLTEYAIEARDRNSLLDSTIVETPVDYADADDQTIIQGLLASYLPAVSTANVALTSVLSTFHVEQESLRNVLTRLQELTGAEYFMTPEDELFWRLPTAQPAPYSLSETPDGVTSIGFDRLSFKHTREWRTPANRVTIIGAVGSGGANISATEEDKHSQSAFGIFGRTVVDRGIGSALEARDRALVELARYAWPQVAGSFTTRQDGFDVGQMLTISAPTTINLSGSYLIRRVQMKWLNKTTTQYDIEFGDYFQPDLARALRRIAARAEGIAAPPVANPAPSSIVPGSFAGTIEPVRIVSSLPALPDSAYTANSIVLLTTDRKLYRRSGNTWTAAVPTIDLTGTITNTQIADDSISTPKLQALVVTAEKIGANAVIAGKVAADAIIAGNIAAGAIRAVDAVFEAAAIQAADIGSINADVITTGSLVADRITTGTISVGTGTLAVQGTASSPAGNFRVRHNTSSYMVDLDGTSSVAQILARNDSLPGYGKIVLDSTTSILELAVGSSPGIVKLIASSGGTGVVQVNGTQVLTSRQTGWTAPTGTATRSGFATSTVTLEVLAQHVKALIDDIMTHGAIGA